MAAARDQAVGGRSGHEGDGHSGGGDDPADPLAGRLALGVGMPPGGAVGVASLGVLGGLLAVLAVPFEEAELAEIVTLRAWGQEFPYAVPCPATQSRGDVLSPGLTSGNRS